MFDDAGVKPIRACGTRWICHKLSAMKRVISKYGAFIGHLSSLSEDRSIRSADRAKLKGFYNRWTEAKYILGCAVFIDILSPCATFSKCMQNDDLDILGALTSLFRTVKEIDQLSKRQIEHWPTYNLITSKITKEEGEHVYQLQTLKRFSEAKTYYDSHLSEYCTAVTSCIKHRLEWSNLDLMKDIIFVIYLWLAKDSM